jgi:BirA family transcriptional regulator, biotin operon repressor / biotin---[acetyl-CoA-carboxylase] ligase
MDVLHAMAGEGAADGTAIIAEEQTEGRGSRGRTWHSPRGGLWLSVLARPSVPSGLDPMSLRAGLAVSRAVASLAPGERLRLKWPNDLMLGERKVGGILCEARWQGDTLAWVVVGLGLNVANAVPDAVRETAANLAQRWPDLDPAALVEPVVTAIRAIDVRSARLNDSELRSFHALDWLVGRALTEPIAGVAEGVEADAALRVRQADGRLMLARTGTVALAESSFRA